MNGTRYYVGIGLRGPNLEANTSLTESDSDGTESSVETFQGSLPAYEEVLETTSVASLPLLNDEAAENAPEGGGGGWEND